MSETNSEIINIILAIQQQFLCNGVKAVFDPFDDIHIIGELDKLENLIDSIKDSVPEIVIISTGENNTGVFNYIKTIKATYPGVSVIIILENVEDELIYTALGLGVSACLSTGVLEDELINCVRKVSYGEYPIIDTLTRPEIAQLIFKDMASNIGDDTIDATNAKKTLSNEESALLSLVAGGYTFDQLISSEKNSASSVMQHLTNIYGKLVFNNFCEFLDQPSEKPITLDQSTNFNSIEANTTVQIINQYTPKQSTEKVDNINVNDINIDYPSIWDGFEILNKEFQKTLEKLASIDDNPVGLSEEEHTEISGNIKENIIKNESTDKSLLEVMTETHNQSVDDFDIVDKEHGLQSDNISEEMPPVNENENNNSESEINKFVINKVEESGKVSKDTLESNSVITPTDLAKNEKKAPKRINGDSKDITQNDHKHSQEEILSAVKGLGVPVFIQTPVDRKQLEKLESIIKNTDGINIILRKGTSREHILVISGKDPHALLKILSEFPLVESTSDENGTINIKLLPMTDKNY